MSKTKAKIGDPHVKIGIVGCGFIGLKHVQSFTKVPGCQLQALSDIRPERMSTLLQEVAPQLPAAGGTPIDQHLSYRDLIQNPQVDVVVVTVISGLHAQIATEALQNGKHVIVEKPLALSAEEARTLLETANQSGKKVAVCHQKRFFPHLQQLRDLIQSGKIGQVVQGGVSLMYNRDERYYQEASWRGTWAQDGGVLLNQAIHDIDLLLWMIGKPIAIQGQLSRLLRPIEAEDAAVVSLRLPNGTLARIEATVCADRSSAFERIEVMGTKGSFTVRGKFLEQIETWNVEGEPRPVFQNIDPYEALYQDFLAALHEDREPYINGAEGFLALETILAAYQSALTQQQVKLPLGNFSVHQMKNMPL